MFGAWNPISSERDVSGGGPAPGEEEVAEVQAAGGSPFTLEFIDPNPREIFVGAYRLDRYLEEREQTEPLKIREFLRSLDYSDFERAYKPSLRRPYAVVSMIGLILYGIMRGISSLRELERLARLDLGCQWITGGLMPDHSSLGRFINRHEALLKESYFEGLTREVLKRTGGNTSSVAGDGTVIQAATSRYGTLKAEAAEERARKRREQANAAPSDEKAQEKAHQAERTAVVAKEREEARRAKGRDKSSGVVAPSEPEAVIQPLKNGAKAPAYKASVTVNSQRIVTGKEVLPSSEVQAVEPMLSQTERIGDRPVQQARYDAGYFCEAMIALGLEKNLDLLIPEGKANTAEDFEKRSSKQFAKSRFVYESEHDRYRCPAGKYLLPAERCRGSATQQAYTRYMTDACGSCALRSQCTTGKEGRSLKRYEGDEGKEALRAVMQQEGARAEYRKRQAWVEPVFSELTGVQKLKRFRRRGLAKVKVEFSLHTCAHNLRRYLALAGAQFALAVLLLVVLVVCLSVPGAATEPRLIRRSRRITAQWQKMVRELAHRLESLHPRLPDHALA
jgi:transposase